MAQVKQRPDGSYYLAYSVAEGGSEKPITQEEARMAAIGQLQVDPQAQQTGGPALTPTANFGQPIQPITTAPPNATAASLMPSAPVMPSQGLLDQYRAPSPISEAATRTAALAAKVKAAGGVLNPDGTATYSGVYGSAKPAAPAAGAPVPGAVRPTPGEPSGQPASSFRQGTPGLGMVRMPDGSYVPSGIGQFVPGGSGGVPAWNPAPSTGGGVNPLAGAPMWIGGDVDDRIKPGGTPTPDPRVGPRGAYDAYGPEAAGISPAPGAAPTPPQGGTLAPAAPVDPSLVGRSKAIVAGAEAAGSPDATAPPAGITPYGSFKATPFPTQPGAAPGTGPQTAPPPGFTPTQAPTLPGAVAAPGQRPGTFTPTAFPTPQTVQDDIPGRQSVVDAAMKAKYGPQEAAVAQGLERSALQRTQAAEQLQTGLDQSLEDSRRNLAYDMETNRAQWASKNLGSGSGFLAGANSAVQRAQAIQSGRMQRETQQSLGQLAQRGEQDVAQGNAQLEQIAGLKGEAGVAMMDALRRDDRQFALQKGQQALSEWSAQNQVAMQASAQNQQAFEADRNFAQVVQQQGVDNAFRQWATSNQVNAEAAKMARQVFDSDRGFQENVRQFGINQAMQKWLQENTMALKEAEFGLQSRTSDFNLRRGEAMLPFETAAAGLANKAANLKYETSKEMLPSDLATADAKARLAGTQASAANEELYRSNEAYRKYGTLPQDMEFETAKLKRDAAKLEYEIAQDPNIGSRATKQAALNEINARIRASDALANQRNEPPPPPTPKPPDKTTITNDFTAEILDFRQGGATYNYALDTLENMVKQRALPPGLSYTEAKDIIDQQYGQGRYAPKPEATGNTPASPGFAFPK